jgi:hypothetical protein
MLETDLSFTQTKGLTKRNCTLKADLLSKTNKLYHLMASQVLLRNKEEAKPLQIVLENKIHLLG